MNTRLLIYSALMPVYLLGSIPVWSADHEPALPARILLVNAEVITAHQVRMDGNELAITADDGTPSRWPWKEIARIDFRSETKAAFDVLPLPQHEIWLTNGDRIAAFVKEIQDEKLQIGWVEQTNWQAEPIPLESVEVAVLKAPTSSFARASFRRRIQSLRDTAARKDDVALLSNGDELPGEFIELGPEQATLMRSKESVQVPRFRMAALVFNEELLVAPQAAKQRWRVVTNDGSAFTVRELRTVSGEKELPVKLEFLLMTGTRLVVPIQDILTIEFAPDSLQWLDDLPLESHAWHPWLPATVQGSSASKINLLTRQTSRNRLTGIHEGFDETAFWSLSMSPEEVLTWRLANGAYQLSGRVHVSGVTTLSAAAKASIEQNGETLWGSQELNLENKLETFQLDLIGTAEEKLTFRAKSGPAGDQGMQLIWSNVSLRVK
ncbi:hypothetical protein [Planctopirus ephydatiae]|nr:hypothetical protein [Planctopirus ephydatiae]